MNHRFFVLLSCGIAFSCNIVFAKPPLLWKVGDSWCVSLELYSHGGQRNGNNKGIEKESKSFQDVIQYDLHVIILGTEELDGAKCWKVDFLIPNQKPPAGLTARYRVSVDAQDGWPRKVFSFRDFRSLPIDTFDKTRMLTVVPDGYPVEILPASGLLKTKGEQSPYTLMLSGVTETGIRTAILQLGDEKSVEIRQTWKQGEKWWRKYERYRNGQLDLRASLVPTVVAKAPDPKRVPKNTLLLSPSTQAKEQFVEVGDETKNPLRADPRLQGKITLKISKPGVQHFLDHFAQATGLTFTSDENVDTSTPIFAGVNWVNTPVWSAMSQLAEAPAVHGRWDKSATGYRIIGDPSKIKPSSDKTRVNWWLVVLILNLFFAVGLGVLFSRRRGVRTVPASPAPTETRNPTDTQKQQ